VFISRSFLILALCNMHLVTFMHRHPNKSICPWTTWVLPIPSTTKQLILILALLVLSLTIKQNWKLWFTMKTILEDRAFFIFRGRLKILVSPRISNQFQRQLTHIRRKSNKAIFVNWLTDAVLWRGFSLLIGPACYQSAWLVLNRYQVDNT
jgi:hypothetical protein